MKKTNYSGSDPPKRGTDPESYDRDSFIITLKRELFKILHFTNEKSKSKHKSRKRSRVKA